MATLVRMWSLLRASPNSWPLHTGADTLETLAVYLGMLGADFEVDAPPELVAHLRELADRYRRAIR